MRRFGGPAAEAEPSGVGLVDIIDQEWGTITADDEGADDRTAASTRDAEAAPPD